jgi:hypothetical protein
MRCIVRLTIFSALFLIAAACGIDPTTSDLRDGSSTSTEVARFGQVDRKPGAFFPLAVGSEWHYAAHLKSQAIVDGEPQPPEVENGDVSLSIIGTETRFGREYFVAELAAEIGSGPPVTVWVRYRQDRGGLYEADIPISEPPTGTAAASVEHVPVGHRLNAPLVLRLLGGERHALRGRRTTRTHDSSRQPPGGPMSNEITRLVYPLRPGQEWVIRDDPLFESRVDGRDVLVVPAGRHSAWRVWISNDFSGPNDVVHDWYNRHGIIAEYQRTETPYLDPSGAEVGTLINEVFIELTDGV